MEIINLDARSWILDASKTSAKLTKINGKERYGFNNFRLSGRKKLIWSLARDYSTPISPRIWKKERLKIKPIDNLDIKSKITILAIFYLQGGVTHRFSVHIQNRAAAATRRNRGVNLD